jgi:hypothetical protein
MVNGLADFLALVSRPVARWDSRIGLKAFQFGKREHRQQIRNGRRPSTVRLTPAYPSPNNAGMPKPAAVRRIKSYSAESGYVYQYQFQDVHPAKQEKLKGNEYVYYVSSDRKKMFPVRIFVDLDALNRWAKATSRALTGTEEYAVAKMRLFEAFDRGDELSATGPALVVDESNLNALLERLDL